MAGKFLDLNEAAKQLGVTPEELIEMRSRGDVFGVREGASWKFKTEEIERVLSERSGGDSLGLDDLDLAPADSGADSILLEEGPSDGPGRSTIIGQQGGKSAHDSDLKLKSTDPFDDLELAPASGLNLAPPGKPAAPPAASDSLAGDSLGIAGSEYILSDDEPTAKPSGKPAGKSDSALAADDSLSLGDSILDDSRGSAGAASSDLDMGDALSAGDSISLDDEPRIGSAAGTGSHGSGRMLSSGDSGINLRPGDSGLSLEEEPLDLGGSVVESLELPEDSDVVALEEESADPDQATQLKQDDQFLLSPSDELSEEESDSGSQVIALDDSLSLDGEAATMLGAKGQAAAGQPDFAAAGGSDYAAMGMGAAAGMAMGMGAGQPVYVPVEVEEVPYSIWNVLGLLLVTFSMAMCAMLMADVVLNLWIWNEQTSASLFLMNNILSTFGLDK